ncbi:hypothetical protein EDD18DRAFT_1344278 [Armillaria luteobubalina]|uniref:Uncharacterized protein n=1 Tax=Armillaria luteobubalina TaxID=153913 RepID=A0AA39QNA8_9AGAR|nr:hypothetical protein EDD18DRAFT_1344278 [Armillaria luteobubalina]
MALKPASNCCWWHECFEDHPYFALKKPEATQSSKCKVICIPCLNTHIGKVMATNEQEIINGQHQEKRTSDTIKLMLFSTDGNSAVHQEWLVAQTEILLKHLCDCPHQPAAVHDRAQNELQSRSPAKHTLWAPSNAVPMYPFQPSYPIPSHPTSSFVSPGLYLESIATALPISWPPSSSSSAFFAPDPSISQAPSVVPSDSISAVGS